MAADAETVPKEDLEVVSGDESGTNLVEAFRREDAPLPYLYEQTKRALKECERVVKAKEYENRARALEQYARMREDEELINTARRIRLYAARRAGELLREFKRDPEKNLPGFRSKGAPTSGDDRPTTQREAAERAGYSKHQEVQATRIADVPNDEFDAAVASEEPPSLSEMAKRGMDSTERDDSSLRSTDEEADHVREPTSREQAAQTFQEGIERFAWWCRVHDPAEIRAELDGNEISEAEEQIEEVIVFLEQFREPKHNTTPASENVEAPEHRASGGKPEGQNEVRRHPTDDVAHPMAESDADEPTLWDQPMKKDGLEEGEPDRSNGDPQSESVGETDAEEASGEGGS